MARPFYLEAVAQDDPDFLPLIEPEREFVMKDGAIPGKYKALMTMVCEPRGVRRCATPPAHSASVGSRHPAHRQ